VAILHVLFLIHDEFDVSSIDELFFSGWLYDANQSYDLSFCIAGSLMLLSGLMILPVRWILKCKQGM